MYGLNPERTRYLDAPDVKPPFSIRWRFKGEPPARVLARSWSATSSSAINNNGLAFAVKTSTGKARWKQQIAHLNASSPTFSDHVIYVSNLEPGQVVALAAGRRARDLEAPAARAGRSPRRSSSATR